MCAAESAGLLEGDYVFIAIDFAHLTNSAQTGRPCRMNKALEGLLDITIRFDEDYAGYQEFVHELNRRTNVIHGAEVGIHMGMVYDAVFLYATGLDEAIEQGFTVHNGSEIIRQLLTRSFQALSLKGSTIGLAFTKHTFAQVNCEKYDVDCKMLLLMMMMVVVVMVVMMMMMMMRRRRRRLRERRMTTTM
ncbi:hypothetical protein DPMN_128012 [Dreissena polymorpha]|uniref:Receptor ligand binding region domain-containing protein n=1 Tax=Dreissena polymorpha TaxID=45954 RepID=A0A9D4GYR3_DREPO|nr:hypothetical protein DPMN_128012 [Dreissena polymorpha]